MSYQTSECLDLMRLNVQNCHFLAIERPIAHEAGSLDSQIAYLKRFNILFEAYLNIFP